MEEDEEEGGGRGGVSAAGLELWIRRHSWQIRTWLQPCRKPRSGGGGATRADAGGGAPAAVWPPSESSSNLSGPGPKPGSPPVPGPPVMEPTPL